MQIKSVSTLHRGFLKVQGLLVEALNGAERTFERIVHSPVVIGICHDPINDQIMLVEQYRYGAMMNMKEFPAGCVDRGEEPHKALAREVLEETGVELKSSTLIYDAMSMPGSMLAPMSIFYVTFDSRMVEEGKVLHTSPFEATKVNLMGAKQLIREVENNQHQSLPVIIGAQYIKLLHRGLVK